MGRSKVYRFFAAVLALSLLPAGSAFSDTAVPETPISAITSISGTVVSIESGISSTITVKDGSGKITQIWIDRPTTVVSGLGYNRFDALKVGQEVALTVKYQVGLGRFLAKEISVTKEPAPPAETPAAVPASDPAAAASTPAPEKPAPRVLKSGPKSESSS